MNTFRINSNSISALVYRNLSKSQFNLQTALERLSSGLRVNKVSDDSAGSAISTRMNNQIQGMKQANENAQQANNLIQTAENGLNNISGMLSRMRELAVQASTDTLNNTDRASIDLEYQALKNEITRIANVTQYNEMDILNGTDYRNQVNADNSTADDVSGVSIQTLDEVIKGTYTLQDTLETSSSGQLVDANVTHTGGDSNISISADGDVAAGDYRLIRNNSGNIKLEKTLDGGTTWTLASTDTIFADSVSQGSNIATFHTTNGDVTVTFQSTAVAASSVEVSPTEAKMNHRDRGDVNKIIDGNNSTNAYLTSSYTQASHFPLILDLTPPANIEGKILNGIKIVGYPWSNTFDGGDIDMKFSYDRDESSTSLGLAGISQMSKTENQALTTTAGQVDFSDDASWHVQGFMVDDTLQIDFNGDYTIASGDIIKIRWQAASTYQHWAIREISLISGDESGSGLDPILNEFTVSSNRTLSLTDADGNSQDSYYTAGSSETLSFSDFGIQVDLDGTYAPSSGLDGTNIEIAASRDLQVGADNDTNHHLQLGISSATASGLRIDGSRVVDIDQARAAITSLDNATDMVNQERSLLGSMQNRLAFTMSNLTSQTQNIEASRSSIEDADFAAEAADLAKNQILAQSATAMLAQASAISQNILGLLR